MSEMDTTQGSCVCVVLDEGVAKRNSISGGRGDRGLRAYRTASP